MFTDWTPPELDYFLSVAEGELESILAGMSDEEATRLAQSMARRLEEQSRDEWVQDKESLGQRLKPSISGRHLDRYEKKGLKLTGPPYSVLASQAEYDRVRKETGLGDEGSDSELRRERLRADIAEKLQNVRSKQIKNDRADGSTAPIADFVQWARIAFEELRREFETAPDAAAKVVPAEFRTLVYQEVRSVVYSIMKRLAAKRIEPGEFTE